MGQHFLNSIIAMVFSFSLMAAECEKLLIEGKNKELCFYGDKSFFISKNCYKQKSCPIIEKLLKIKMEKTSSDRPGMLICEKLKGHYKVWNIDKETVDVSICEISQDSFLSLNALESWDGKKFNGPAPKLKF